MTPTDDAITEHLLRVLPTSEAEPLYLESRCTDWATAVGVFGLDGHALPDGTPLHSAVTGRKCRTDWRTLVPIQTGSAWEELSLLRLTTEAAGGKNPFAEIEDKKLITECAAFTYRH